jgi:hypothetical protein
MLLFVVLGVWLAALPLPARAQSAPEGRGSDPAWQASYWTNPTLAGDPILTRDEANIAYNWGSGSPAPQVPGGSFLGALVALHLFRPGERLPLSPWPATTARGFSSTARW